MFELPVDEISVKDLLKQHINFVMPSYQRGYRWREKQVQALIDDFHDKWKNGGEGEYLLQPIVICRGCDEVSFKVIDGQQRLRTLRELVKGRIGADDELWTVSCDNESFDKERLTAACLTNARRVAAKNASRLDEIFPAHLADIKLIYYNIDAENNKVSGERRENKVFEDLNANKIGLTDSELIRALYLGGSDDITAYQVAAEWEQIEARLQDDAFWYMFNGREAESPTRMDKLFAIVTKTENSTEKNPAYHVFEKDIRMASDGAEKRKCLSSYWDRVLGVYWMLEFCFKNICAYHYVGWIRHMTNTRFSTLWKLYEKDRPRFVNNMRLLILGRGKEIKEKLEDVEPIKGLNLSAIDNPCEFSSVLRYMYPPAEDDGIPSEFEDSKIDKKDIVSNSKELNKLLLLFNLETLNQTFVKTHDVNERMSVNRWDLKGVEYYRYPFSLHSDQEWNIEHVGSHTDTPMDPESDFKECLEWAIDVLRERASSKDLARDVALWVSKQLEDASKRQKFEEVLQRMRIDNDVVPSFDGNGQMRDFASLYKSWVEELPPGTIMKQRDKNAIGNLVLLDERTNKSYKNAIFGRKRREMLDVHIADKNHKFRFVPPCTVDVLCQKYSANPVSRLVWSKEDADNHRNRIVDVLGKMWKDASDENK